VLAERRPSLQVQEREREQVSAKKIGQITGKVLQEASIQKSEASDGCLYVSLLLKFKDGSSYEMQFISDIAANGIFFKDLRDDDNVKEVALVRP
jgi:hypothetical protein